jgi:hypothetical protein
LLKMVLETIHHNATSANRSQVLHNLSRVCLALRTKTPTPDEIDTALEALKSDGRISAVESPESSVTNPFFRANFPPEQEVDNPVWAALVAHEKLCTDDMTLAQLISTVRDDITTSARQPTASVTQSLYSLMQRGKVQRRSNSRGEDTYAPKSTRTSPQLTYQPNHTTSTTTPSDDTQSLDPGPPPDDPSLGASTTGHGHPADICEN